MSEVNADVKKKALCWTRYMSDNDVCWTRGQSQKKRILYTPFFWHSIGWVEIFYLFIFIWEVRIRHWSRNLSQKFYRDGSEIQIDVSSHFDEAKTKSIYCDWAKFKLMYRRISRIRAKTSMPSLAIWKRRWVYRIPRWERRRVCRVSRLERRWVCRVLQFWDYNIIRCCDACLVDGICFHFVCIMHCRFYCHL